MVGNYLHQPYSFNMIMAGLKYSPGSGKLPRLVNSVRLLIWVIDECFLTDKYQRQEVTELLSGTFLCVLAFIFQQQSVIDMFSTHETGEESSMKIVHQPTSLFSLL